MNWAAVDGEQCADVHELNATAMCIAWAAVDGEQCVDVHELNATAMHMQVEMNEA